MSRRRALHDDSEEDEANTEGWKGTTGEEKLCSSYEFSTELRNPLAWLAVPWHVVMVVFYSLLLYHGRNLVFSNMGIMDPTGKIPALGGHFKYLTHINQWVQLVFFSLQLLNDITPCRYKKGLQKISSFLFTTLAFPVSALVTLTFWGLYAIDRRLVYPEVFDTFVPGYMNHFWHTTILLWVVCEIHFVFHEFPNIANAACSVFLFGSIYIGWVVYIFATTNWWVYPFMKLLSPVVMVLFFASCLFVTLGFHLVGKAISYFRWGTTCTRNKLDWTLFLCYAIAICTRIFFTLCSWYMI